MAPTSKPELLDGHVSAQQCKLAVDALLQHETKRLEEQAESQLLPGKEQHVWLVITVKQMHPEKKLKPHRIPVAHPIVDPRTSPVCLISKDPQREYKDLLEEKQIRFISRVVGIEKLKGKFKGYEERRMLLKENDLFLADERVIPLLPGLLGKKWFEAKKQPIPVCLTRKDLKSELERAISSTYFHQNRGTCSSIKIGTVSQSANHVFDNLKTALPAVVKAIKGEWDNIQSLHIKTNSSTALPIWTCDLGAGEGGRWSGLTEMQMGEAGHESEGEAKSAPIATRSSKKRAAGEEEVEQPKKKAKSSAESLTAAVPTSDKAKTSATKSRKGKEVAIDAVSAETSAPTPSSASTVESAATPSTPTSGKRKERHRKLKAAASEAVATSSTPQTQQASEAVMSDASRSVVAPASTETEQPSKKKKRKPKVAVADSTSRDAAKPTSSVTAASTASSGLASQTAAPSTPNAPRSKEPRASATDFFSDEDDVPDAGAIAPPPNTPAAGITAHKRKRSQRGEQTPVSKAIGKLVEETTAEAGEAGEASEPANAPQKTKSKKEKRKKKVPAAPEGEGKGDDETPAVESSAPASAPTPAEATIGGPITGSGEKKKRKDKKQSQTISTPDAPTPAPAPATVSAGDVKAKLSTSGAEKKKEKALKSKKSVKDALIGRKGL